MCTLLTAQQLCAVCLPSLSPLLCAPCCMPCCRDGPFGLHTPSAAAATGAAASAPSWPCCTVSSWQRPGTARAGALLHRYAPRVAPARFMGSPYPSTSMGPGAHCCALITSKGAVFAVGCLQYMLSGCAYHTTFRR